MTTRRIRKFALPIVFVAASAVALSITSSPASGTTAQISAATHAAGFTKNQLYTFPGTKVPAQWGVYDSTGETSTTDSRNPSYVTVSGGLLHVKASGDQGSGLCLCADGASPTKPYGRWDVYANLPVDAHHDFGILLWPNKGQPKPGQEIDIAEFPGPSKTVLQNTVHTGPGNSKHSNFTNGKYSGYHKFSVIWTASGVSFWVDETKVWQTDSTFAPTDAMHLVLQGGIYSKSTPTSGTSHMDVKAVRYFHN